MTWEPLPPPPFEASVNTPTVTDAIRPDGPVDLTKFEFGEAGIDLSGLDLSGNGGHACESFGSVVGGSRTSKSGDTAQLKDFVGPAPARPLHVRKAEGDDHPQAQEPGGPPRRDDPGRHVGPSPGRACTTRPPSTHESHRQKSGRQGPVHVLYQRDMPGQQRHRCGSGAGRRAGERTSVEHANSARARKLQLQRAVHLGQRSELCGLGPSVCEPFTVDKASLGVNTTVHSDSPDQALAGSLPLNGGAHDSASVTGKVGSFALPDVTFYFFPKGTPCTSGSTTGATVLNTLTPDRRRGSRIRRPARPLWRPAPTTSWRSWRATRTTRLDQQL